VKELEYLLIDNEKSAEKLLKIEQEKESETKAKIQQVHASLEEQYKFKQEKLASLGANSMVHALSLIDSLLSLSKSLQLHQKSLGSFANFVTKVFHSFETQLKKIETRKAIQENLTEDLVSTEEIVEWTMKTWNDKNIADKVKANGITGGLLASFDEASMTDCMKELGIVGPLRQAVWKRKWGTVLSVNRANKMIDFMKSDIDTIQNVFTEKDQSLKDSLKQITASNGQPIGN